MLHHSLSRIVAQAVLNNWRVNYWKKSIISNEVHLGQSQVLFPSPDATFIDPKNKFTITMEFKPPTASKREILTGLGQAISYLDFSSIAYLAIPEFVENFNMQEYMYNLFEKRKINSNFPIGLIIYDNSNPSEIKFFKDIDIAVVPEKIYKDNNIGRYWAPYKDSNPHTIWLLLDIAYNLDSSVNRKEQIWETFFDNYYCPIEKRYNLEECTSNIVHWNEGNNKGFADSFKEAKIQYEAKQITEKELKTKIDNIIGKTKNNKDNLYKSYRKNRLPFLSHLGLWNEQYYLTELGYDLHKIGKIYGATSNVFKDKLANIVLIEGKHLDLILDIENITRNKNFDSVGKAKQEVANELEKKGLIKRNPNRSPDPGNAKDDFSSEFQLWNKLGFVLKEGNSFYLKNKGFNFNWNEITRILSI